MEILNEIQESSLIVPNKANSVKKEIFSNKYIMVPFGCINIRPVILPLLMNNEKYVLLDINKIDDLCTFDWLKKAQPIWDAHKTAKSKQIQRLKLIIFVQF